NALTLSPALAAILLKPRKSSRGPLGRFFDGFNRWFDKATQGYVQWSHALIRKGVVALLIIGAFAGLDALLGSRLPTSFLPDEDYGYLLLNVQLPPAASLERTDQVCRKVEAILDKTDGIQAYNTIGGVSMFIRVSANYNGYFFFVLKPCGGWTSTYVRD